EVRPALTRGFVMSTVTLPLLHILLPTPPDQNHDKTDNHHDQHHLAPPQSTNRNSRCRSLRIRGRRTYPSTHSLGFLQAESRIDNPFCCHIINGVTAIPSSINARFVVHVGGVYQ